MTQTSRPLRFGLVGTGYWARITHAPALARTEGAELTAVWGRDPRAAADLAAEYQATAHHDVSAFLAAIDAVSFAVPPDVQALIATQAAIQGKHLLLEKPVALSVSDADKLVDAVDAAGVASVVFFTHQFNTEIRAWLADERARGAGGVFLSGSEAKRRKRSIAPLTSPARAKHLARSNAAWGIAGSLGNCCWIRS